MLYHKKPSNSAIQLKDDFLEYPPKPLKCDAPEIKFNIVFASRIGATIHKFISLMKLLKKDSSSIDFGDCELAEVNAMKGAAINITHGVTAKIKEEYQSLNSQGKILFSCVIALLFPLIISVVICYAIAFSTFMLFRLHKGSGNRLGYFLSIFKDEREIVVNQNLILKRGRNLLSIISHEHIHLLQHIYKSKCNAGVTKIKIRDPYVLLHKEVCCYKHLIYTLEKDELEARLHEIVLSYYREFRCIPLTIDGFISLLSGCRELGGFITEAINEIDGHFFSVHQGKPYSIRGKSIADEIEFILSEIKSTDLIFKFISEVLAVMYGNLIGCYGDQDASRAFLKQIKSPNLYDRLYG